jgi:hypothetical protein
MENQKIFLVIGNSGSGKTSSLRNMPLEKTVLINTELKSMLPFKGHHRLKKHWLLNDVHKLMMGLKMLEEDPEVEYIVLDSLSYLMNMYELQVVKTSSNTMRTWGDYGDFYRNLIMFIKSSCKNWVIMCHPKEIFDEKAGEIRVSAAIKGSLSGLIEADFNVVVYTDITVDEEGMPQYRFLVKKTKESLSKSVKSPFDMFDESHTKSNDVMEVFESITKYINGDN